MKKETIERIRKFTEERDWDQFHSPANLAKSIVIEASKWLTKEELDLVDWLPAEVTLIDKIREVM